MIRRVVFTLVLGLVALAVSPAVAGQVDYKLKIFGGAAYVSPLSESSVEGVGNAVKAASAVGWEIGGEWKPFNRFGFEVSYLDSTNDVEVDGAKVGEVTMRPWTFTVNWHVINGEHLNWYVGPSVSYVDWGSVDSPTTEPVPVESETAYGLSTGIDLALGKSFAIFGGLRWLNTGIQTADGSENVDVNPLFARLGVAFRF